MFLVVLDDFLDDESEEFLGEFRVQIGPLRQVFEPFDLQRFARWIGRGKVVLGFEFPHSLRVFEPLSERVNEDRVEPVDALTMVLEHLGGAGGVGGHFSGPLHIGMTSA